MKSIAAIVVFVMGLVANIGHCESVFDISPSNTLGDLRPKFKNIELMPDFGDASFPVYMVKSPHVKGFLLVTFFDSRSAYPSMRCIQNIPNERALRVARVQFVPSSPPQTQAMLAKYGRNYSEKYDDNLKRTLTWKDMGIEAVLDPSGKYVESVINDFTAKEQEAASQMSAASIFVATMGCSE